MDLSWLRDWFTMCKGRHALVDIDGPHGILYEIYQPENLDVDVRILSHEVRSMCTHKFPVKALISAI